VQTDQDYVGCLYGKLLLNYPSLPYLACGLGMAQDDIYSIDQDLIVCMEHLLDTPLLAPVSPFDYQDVVVSVQTHLQDLRGEGHDPHEVLVPELAGDRAEDPRTARHQIVVDEDSGIVVEADVGAVDSPL